METDSEPYQQILIPILELTGTIPFYYAIVGILVIVISLCLSALFSSSENAFFSLTPGNILALSEDKSKASSIALELINEPDRKSATRRLLATILLMNNLVNIFIVIFSSWLFQLYADYWQLSPLAVSLLQIGLITFLLVLLGEIIPKIYATQNNLKVVKLMAAPLRLCFKVFKPLVLVLAGSSSIFDSRIKKRLHNISNEEISQAIDLADENRQIEEKHILKGIINFSNTSVKQIMKPRTEVACIDESLPSMEVLELVSGWNYSRIPVYEGSFDNVKGLLYVKDLLPYLQEPKAFDWLTLLRHPLFVPETKKIDDLLEEFQENRIHMAIVVDEYGGTSGIVTMEDILEEVFGEIRDEFDEDEMIYSQLDEDTYIFKGNMSLNDIVKVMDLELDTFDEIKGDSDTLAGLVLEIHGQFPNKGDVITIDGFSFAIESVDERRIQRIKVKRTSEAINDESDS